MTNAATLKVTSHVGRDILASAAHFKTEAAVVWEYVANSLQYVDPGTPPKVQVLVKQKEKQIEVRDNGRGMDETDLQHFFTMHGENLDRRAGRPGRGKFGTGKSAAFGIASSLRVDTRRNGFRNVTQLSRNSIDRSNGRDVPVEVIVHNEATGYGNGTTVSITELLLDRINTPSIIEYLERHLSAFRYLHPEVAVNNYLCSSREITVAKMRTFRPSPEQSRIIGDVELVIKVAQAPLNEDDQGIVITAGPGNLVAKESAGIEKKEFGNYLFGETDIIALETSESLIEPYDSTRSLQLNPKHPVAAVLLSFLGSKLEEMRQQLAHEVKEARRTEQARRLSAEAQRIAEIINQDFNDVRERLRDIRSASASPGSVTAVFGNRLEGGSDTDVWMAGTQEIGRLPKTSRGRERQGDSQREAPQIAPIGRKDEAGDELVDPAGGNEGKSRPRGGFKVEYRDLGKDEGRSKYDSNTLSILINLDHPVVVAALGPGNVQDPAFRRLSYEIAFSEYAMALGYEICKQDPNIPGDDLLYEVRTCLNRISAAAAPLYR